MADAFDLRSSVRKGVGVQVPLPGPKDNMKVRSYFSIKEFETGIAYMLKEGYRLDSWNLSASGTIVAIFKG